MSRALLLLPCLLALACGAAEEVAPDTGAATLPRATLLLDPPVVEIGDVVSGVIAVVSPPGHRVLPVTPPEIPGAWLLDTEALETVERDRSWLHRTRIRIRPRELGTHEWPGTEVVLERDDGVRKSLPVASRSFEVVSVWQRVRRERPFGLRTPSRGSGAASFAWGAAAGAGAALAAVALVLLARRRVRTSVAPETEAEAALRETLFGWSQAEHARATRLLEQGDADGAASVCAHMVRTYTARRFGADTLAASTDELGAAPAPAGARSRWPELVRVLRTLDDARFRPHAGTAARREERIQGALDGALRFVEDSLPPEIRA